MCRQARGALASKGIFMDLWALNRFSRAFAAAADADASPAEKIVAKLRPGEVLVQNDADSEIGRAVILRAKDRGVTTLNIIADKPGAATIVEELKEIGADIVVTESYTNTWYVKRLIGDIPRPVLGLNTSNGSQATAVAKLLAEGGTFITHGKQLPKLVSYPGAERRPIQWAQLLQAKKLKSETLEDAAKQKREQGYLEYIAEIVRKILPSTE